MTSRLHGNKIRAVASVNLEYNIKAELIKILKSLDVTWIQGFHFPAEEKRLPLTSQYTTST